LYALAVDSAFFRREAAILVQSSAAGYTWSLDQSASVDLSSWTSFDIDVGCFGPHGAVLVAQFGFQAYRFAMNILLFGSLAHG